jgi:hypothetical protein
MASDHALAEAGPGRLIAYFLAGRSPATTRAYAADLEDLARSQGSSPEGAVRSLLLGPETAHRQLPSYAIELCRRGLAPATVRRRLTTLRALLGTARELGLVTRRRSRSRRGRWSER